MWVIKNQNEISKAKHSKNFMCLVGFMLASAISANSYGSPSQENKDYLFNMDNSGRINATPIHVSKSFEYFSCDKVIGNRFGDWGIDTLTELAKSYEFNAPKKSLCTVSQGKEGTMFANTIKVSYHSTEADFNNCTFKNNCTARNSVDLQVKNGQIYYNTTIQRGADIKMACFNSSGQVVNTKGCYAVQ